MLETLRQYIEAGLQHFKNGLMLNLYLLRGAQDDKTAMESPIPKQ